MEGPTVLMAKEEFQPFVGKTINVVSGNTFLPKELFQHQKVKDIFCWGKHLVFQFEDFALRVHFMIAGTFVANVEGQEYLGDYAKTNDLKLKFEFDNGWVEMYSCNLKLHPNTPDLKPTYDYTVDVLSDQWDEDAAFAKVQKKPNAEIGDVILDQKIFAGVGNKMRNEELFAKKILPTRLIKDIDVFTLREIVKETHDIAWQFYHWRQKGELGKDFKIYRKKTCPVCGGKVSHEYTGKNKRSSYFCKTCQT